MDEILAVLVRRFQKIRRSEQGLTMLELIVVLIIIAILIAIVAVVFLGSQNNAKDASARVAVKNVTDALNTLKTGAHGKGFHDYSNSQTLKDSVRIVEPTYSYVDDTPEQPKQIQIDKTSDTVVHVFSRSASGKISCSVISPTVTKYGLAATPEECIASATVDPGSIPHYAVCGNDFTDKEKAISWALTRVIWQTSSQSMWANPRTNPPHHTWESGSGFWLNSNNYSSNVDLLDDSGDDLGRYLWQYSGHCPNLSLVNANKHRYSKRGLIASAKPITEQTVTIAYYLWSGAPLDPGEVYDHWNRATFVINDGSTYYCALWRGSEVHHWGKIPSSEVNDVNSASGSNPYTTKSPTTLLDGDVCNAQDFPFDNDGSGHPWSAGW